MKKTLYIPGLLTLVLVCSLVLSGTGQAACRNPNLVRGDGLRITPAAMRITPAAMSGGIEIAWFGHSFFQITSSKGTRIITDPFGYMGFPMPQVWPHVVTVGREQGNHNNVGLAHGNPLILRGMKMWGGEWNEINTTFRDVLIYNVPIHTRSWRDSLKGTAFVFEMDGLCILHTGDLGEPFNKDQLNLIGHVDILLVPIGGRFAMNPENAKKVVEQLKPGIAVPMHYYNNTLVLDSFLDVPLRKRFFESNTFSASKDTLPPPTEIFIPRVVWYGRDYD